MRTTEESLKRQSLLVAGVCVAVDGLGVVLRGMDGWVCWVVLLATVGANCALAAPARLSGWVAGLHAVVRVGIILLPSTSSANEAGMLIASYRVGAWLRGFPAVASLVVMCAASAAEQLLLHGRAILIIVVMGKLAILPWLVGRYTTARRAYLAHLEQQSELERRDAQAAVTKAITAERSAIARDLHDVIIHHVSAIGLHAGAARLRLTSGNTRLEESLRSVETASRAAMVDLRHLLDLLHGDNSDGASQPGLGNLDELFDGVRAAGVPAQLSVSGAPQDVPESLDITMYRIVQEMLTNALRHGDLSGVQVELDYEPSSISLSASNPVGAPRDLGGTPRRGLVGIHNRASMFQGRTVSGLEPGGQIWRTTVTFPLEAK
ncbi:sensor histidine kinase [Actinocrispum wychmicini]|uniref:histidine kinase n=1 Tax=Actinocrispum wychmicini TaxID=1213861 RepID=A0A4R2IUL3_9PSEU|nr:histidine kinase [Actinocrispum wychmicini]TCO48146.1 signal transduction histidine kinase [Actinocrispum wychmicini]